MAQEKASPELADLRKRAKKLKIDFDKESTAEELKVLVEAGEAAAQARKEEADKGGTIESRTQDPKIKNPEAKVGAVSEGDPVVVEGGNGKEEVVATLKTKTGHIFRLIISPEGEVELRKTPNILVQSFGPVTEPNSLEAGKKHLENLSRF